MKKKVEWKKLWFPPINLWTVPKRKDNDIRKHTKKDSNKTR